jgi:hypothetical protein
MAWSENRLSPIPMDCWGMQHFLTNPNGDLKEISLGFDGDFIGMRM